MSRDAGTRDPPLPGLSHRACWRLFRRGGRFGEPPAPENGFVHTPAERTILARERSALDRWCQGDPSGYLDIFAGDVTYFDDIGAHRRVEGLAAARQYLTSLQGQIPVHCYEIVDPRLQLYGDVGVLTLRYHASTPEGQPMTRWKATSVYRLVGEEWRIVHAHWSTVKEP